MKTHTSVGPLVLLVALSGCAAESLSETSQAIIDYGKAPLNLTWSNASHNTYVDANTRGASIISHFGDKDGDGSGEGEYADTNHIEIDLRDNHYFPSPQGTVLAGFPGDWIVAHGEDEPFTSKCGAETSWMLSDCLDQIAAFHALNPNHPLITVWFDKKQDWQSLTSSTSRSPQRLNDMILARFSPDDLFKPSYFHTVDNDTLRSGLIEKNWPSHDKLVGKIAFFITAEADANKLLREMITTLGWSSVMFPAVTARSFDEVATPPSFEDDDDREWAVVYNFDWEDLNDDGECDSDHCRYLAEAHDRGYLTRAYDLDDPGEADMASSRPFIEFGYGHANFVPVDFPWRDDIKGGHGNFPDGIYPW